MGLSTLTLVGLLLGVGQVPNDLATINHRNIQIPLKFVAGRRAEVRELLLFVSRNQGKSWEQEAVATPDKDAFPFFAPADGVYWFQVMIVDKKGGRDPVDVYATPPGLKVLVDTTAPVIRLTPSESGPDEVAVAWEIQEPYADLKTFRLEYATYGADGVATWRPVTVTPTLSGTTKFRPASPGSVRVRLTVLDMAGNKGELSKDLTTASSRTVAYSPSPTPMPMNSVPLQQTSLNQSTPMNPGLTLPGNEAPLVSNSPNAPTMVLPNDLNPPAPMPVPAPMAIGSSDLPPAPPTIPPRPQPFQPVPQPMMNPIPQPQAQPQLQPMVSNPAPMLTDIGQPETGAANPLAVSNGAPAAPSSPSLPAAQSVNNLEFDLAYDVEQVGPSGVARAELWVTRDDGRTWMKWCEDEDRKSPIAVNLNTKHNAQVEGIYGFKVVLQSGAGLSKGPPVAGDLPDMRIDVDITAPLVKIYNPVPDTTQRDILHIRWEAVDRNIAPGEPITLEWSEMPDGPWRPIVMNNPAPAPLNQQQVATSSMNYGNGVSRVANSGTYPWRLPAQMPTHRVYLRISARDAAGNIAVAKTPQPIEVDLQKPVAKIQGIIGPRR